MAEKKLISYFVAYRIGTEAGNSQVVIDRPITHMGYIKQFEDELRDQLIEKGIPEAEIGKVIVTNFQRFETEEEPCIIQR